ncbi:MAG: four helix bundle suffix domain-containing protein [Verrucomicrobiota bacterium]|jgi:four helix bundle suffix protein
MTHPAQPDDRRGFIRPHGNYRNLKCFRVSEVVYDATVKFCNRFIDPRSRTHDQMVQAARSSRQNIAEGSQVSAVSRKSELKLVGVARASLEELLLDYEDFLRQRGLKPWSLDDPTAQTVRYLAYAKDNSYAAYSTYVEQAPAEIAANTVLCLIHQARYLLDLHLEQLGQEFLTQGGFTESLYRARLQARQRQDSSNPSAKP